MKTRHVLTAITLAITLATGAVPVYATTNAWDQIGERKVRIEQLKAEADTLEARIKALSDAEAPAITTEEETDALAHDSGLKKLQKDADSARTAWETASEAAEEASAKVEAAQDAVRDYQDACKTFDTLLSAGMTLDDKLAADSARIAAINKEIKELETTPVSNAYDEKTLIKEAYDETRLVKEAYDEQELVSEAYDEEVKVGDAHTEEVEGDWTWTLPENASWADAIYKYGCICNTCNEIFYDDENETGQQKWSRHSDEMYVAWNNAGRPEKGTSPLWGHGGYHVAPRIVGYTVYYDDIYETVHHDPVYTTIHHDAEYTTIHHDAEYTTIHHDAVYDTEKINALKAERDALEAERETLLSHEDIVKKKEAAEQALPMLLATAKQLADQEIVCKDKSDAATLAYQKALVGSVKVRIEQKLEELRKTIDKEKVKTPEEFEDGFYTLPGVYEKQIIRLVKVEDYYVIYGEDGRVLDVAGGRKTDGASVHWYAFNGTNAQKWLPLKNGAILSKETGYLLTQDKNGGFSIRHAEGTNGDPSPAQTFLLTKTSANIATVKKTDTGRYIEAQAEDAVLPVLTTHGITLEEGVDYIVQKNPASKSVRFTLTGIGRFTGTTDITARVAENGGFESGVYYRISTKLDRNKVLTVQSGSLSRSGNVQLEYFSGQLQDYWLFEKQADGSYVIRNARSGLALDVSGGQKTNGANIQQYTPNGTKAQSFIIDQRSAGAYEIINANSQKAVGLKNMMAFNGTNIRQYTPNRSGAQRWYIEAVGRRPDVSGTYKIISQVGHATRAVSVAGTSRDNKANIFLWDAAVSASAKWTFAENNDVNRTWNIRSAYSGKALDVKRAGTHSGTNVQQYSFGNGNNAQKWVLMENLQNETLTIFSVCSGKALDVSGGADRNRANIQIYAPNGTKAQRWMLEKVG